ncbi:hypothetical protein [Anaerobiospirillum succiniciproducens]|uniref:hypothetical protein n=1 Tax=Anaerobiospirillum succiniciproducens TaxID=13335 RepID=UPI002354AA76|nr:hypothetical protein [Anaerobiospirillum succiniciproducens]MCI6863545.1 hypothetical protein [Anaerobiospirillum succiniciproducens]
MGWLSSLFGMGQKDKVSEQDAQLEQAPMVALKSMTLAERLAAMAKEDPLFADMADDETDAEAQAIAQKDINKRNVEENCILAGYLLMHSKGVDQEKISECIDLLLRHANQMYQVPMWNFYLGVAYLYSGQVHVALRYLNVAVDDVEFNVSCQKYLTVCINELQMPELNPNFSQGCSKCYEALTAELDNLSAKIKQEFASESGVGHETYRKVSEILSLAFGRTAFNLDVESATNTARIVLLPVGNIARALQMQFFIDNYPALFNGKLIVSLARSRNENFSIAFKKTQITSKNVKCYLAPSVQGLKVYMYIKELREYLNEDFYGAYKMHLDLFYSAIGELAAACNHITFEALLKNEIPKDSDGQSFTLDRLYNKLLEKGLELDGSNDELLERSFATYENDFKPEPIPDLNEDHDHENIHAHDHKHTTGDVAVLATQKLEHANQNKDESKSEHGTECNAAITTASVDAANASSANGSCEATVSANSCTAADAATATSTATASDSSKSTTANAATSSSNSAAACSTSSSTAVDNRPTYRRDIVKGYTRCYQLIKEYGEVEHRLCDELLERGTVAGFFALKKELFEGENAKISFEAFTAQFRKSLTSGLNGLSIPLNAKAADNNAANDASQSLNDDHGVVGIFVGAAEGLTCYYLDFMSWDTNTLLERTYEILKPLNCYELTYGTFRGDVAALNLVKRPA